MAGNRTFTMIKPDAVESNNIKYYSDDIRRWI